MCELLVSLDIPSNKLKKQKFKNFIETNTQFKSPNESLMRRIHIPNLYENTIEMIRSELTNEFIWLSIDETTDILQRHVFSVIVGPLNPNKSNQRYLMNIEYTEKVNNYSTSQVVLNSLQILWPGGLLYDKVLLLITDAASYMNTSGQTLIKIFPKLIHSTCLAHGIHNVCEFIAKKFDKVDRLIICEKLIFNKCDKRKQILKRLFPLMPSPPGTVKTRWGSWVDSIDFYKTHYKNFRELINQLNPNDCVYIKELQELFTVYDHTEDLEYLSNFKILTKTIKKLEKNGSLLLKSIDLIDNLINELQKLESFKGYDVIDKLDFVLT